MIKSNYHRRLLNYESNDNDNYHNGTQPNKIRSNYGKFKIDTPQNGNSFLKLKSKKPPRIIPERF